MVRSSDSKCIWHLYVTRLIFSVEVRDAFQTYDSPGNYCGDTPARRTTCRIMTVVASWREGKKKKFTVTDETKKMFVVTYIYCVWFKEWHSFNSIINLPPRCLGKKKKWEKENGSLRGCNIWTRTENELYFSNHHLVGRFRWCRHSEHTPPNSSLFSLLSFASKHQISRCWGRNEKRLLKIPPNSEISAAKTAQNDQEIQPECERNVSSVYLLVSLTFAWEF